jgi:diguanylate cyclase (GGDEF)-like protein
VAAGTAFGLALALVHTRKRLAQAERKREALSTFVADRRGTPARSLAAVNNTARPSSATTRTSAVRPAVRDAAPAPKPDEFRGTLLVDYLTELRERLGAEEVVLWRTRSEGRLSPAAWSSMVSGGRTGVDLNGDEPERVPPCFRSDIWMARVEWAASQQMMQFERRGPDGKPWEGDKDAEGVSVTLAVAPISDDMRGYCALSISSSTGLKVAEEQVRGWLGRSASHAGELADLVHTVRASERQVRQANVLVNSAKVFQAKRSVDGLAESVCNDALQITGGARAALIKWDGGAQSGFVQSVSQRHTIEAGQKVAGQSRVGEMCTEDQAQAWEDARGLDRAVPLYSPGETVAWPGSLLVVPMKQEGRVVGAIVVEGDNPHDLLMRDVGHVRMLAAIASASLDQLWHMELARTASITDQLTGLYNRRHFDQQLLLFLSRADQRHAPLSLIVIDVDHFKRVNDTYGHEAGDAVLQAVAAIVQHAVRHGAEGDLCARFGGEEIAILLPGLPAVEALEVAERLRRTIAAKPVVYGGQRISVTASFGVACYPQTVSTHAGFFPSADRALYQAKTGGRNRVKSAGGNDDAEETYDKGSRVKSRTGRG